MSRPRRGPTVRSSLVGLWWSSDERARGTAADPPVDARLSPESLASWGLRGGHSLPGSPRRPQDAWSPIDQAPNRSVPCRPAGGSAVGPVQELVAQQLADRLEAVAPRAQGVDDLRQGGKRLVARAAA